MVNDPKSIIDMGFNTSICASFAVPEAGAGIAAALSGAQFFFDIFFQAPAGDPGDLVPTINDLKGALNSLLAEINDSAFDRDKSDHLSTVEGENDTLNQKWDEMLNPPKDKDNWDGWATKIQKYFDGTAPSTSLDTVRAWLALYPSYKTRTFAIYGLVGSVMIAFHKLGVVWDYTQLIKKKKAELDAYATSPERAAYVSAYAAWKAGGRVGAEPVEKDKPVLDRDDFLTSSNHARDLKKVYTGIYSDGDTWHTEMAKHWDDRKSLTDARVAKIVPKTDGSKYWYEDQETGDVSTGVTNAAIRDANMAGKKGALHIAKWNQLTSDYQLDGVEKADIDKFGETLTNWTAARDSVVSGTIDLTGQGN